ncbi:MAG: dicarboxylate transporter/tellurite-resistance protein TehA [Rothia sp. (in: high G+C Gram-positive bacteria)]|uniref:SLAC1 family transporter n=1 Tax=Rothia sp. (in: high G+C Gram-positive bacteria) TaxID=1885016 RepID=UPI0026DF2E1A|nr:dicarboxylate transporter/tellurite-resistance protein TehA [Rothia sp. (in: high G+C Gram-positive bacteria)]MDO5749915.1 dicarboxylate transporter/tellurite-resistance protein TehA [Rothia sp. (in: high G+C Gram-positive bacteria)]
MSSALPLAESSAAPARPWMIPTSYFSVVLGTFALGLSWRYAFSVSNTPAWVGEGILGVASLLWLVLVVVFGLKVFKRPDAVRAELADPVLCCFLSLIPITTIELGVALLPYARMLAQTVIIAAVIAQLAFAMYRVPGLWRGKHTMEATTAVLYLPTVAANFASSAALASAGWRDWGMLFFGAGLFSWISLEAAVLSRMRTLGSLPAPMRGVWGILLAPPFVGGNAYILANGGEADTLFLILTGYGALQFLFLARLLPWTLQAGYTMSLWGYSFGLGASVSVGWHLIHAGVVPALGWGLVVLSTALLAVLWGGVAVLAVRGRLLVKG